MPEEKRYYKTVFLVTVVDDTPVEWDTLSDITYLIERGVIMTEVEELSSTVITVDDL